MKLKKLELSSNTTEVATPEEKKETIPMEKTIPKKRSFKWLKFTLFFLVILIALGGLGAFFGYQYVKGFESPIKNAAATGNQIATDFKNQDLIAAKASIEKLKSELKEIENRYQQSSAVGVIPFLGSYYQDGQASLRAAGFGLDAATDLIKSIEPYSDLLGFKTDSTSLVEVKSIEDRIVFLVQTLDKIAPQLDSVNNNVTKAKEELDRIDPNRYPEEFMGKSIRGNIILLKQTVSDGQTVLSQAKPLVSILPTLLGDPNPKTYMLLFQNDGELRPTGGFMTAYAYLKVHKGKMEPQSSYNIYDLDNRFGKKIDAPAPIKKYLSETYWNLRNMNISPDFKVSMDTFAENIKSISGLPKIDGIIALDTKVPVRLLQVLGPIGVGGWGNFSANNDPRCDCPQVVYALEDMITRPVSEIRLDRKAVLGPLMHSIAANAMGSPKHMWPKFLSIALEAINQKHLMFYFFDETNQKAAESFNAAGRIKDYNYDYLHINDSNFGGAKSDLFIKRAVEQEIEVSGDKVTKKVTITYENPRKGSNCNLEAGQLCLNGVYRDWVRLFVPTGSKLISVVGTENKETVSEDLGKTVFEAFFTMRPESSSKIVFTYELPKLDLSPYRMLIQKQGGVDSVKHTIILNGKTSEYDITTDKELVLN